MRTELENFNLILNPANKDIVTDKLCNNFWWCLNNVAKGLWREEIPYTMDMISFHIRPMLINFQVRIRMQT
ncbi:MAG TPA: aminoglycoside 6-adenylyltransferase [Lachnospiraceae bacterium]|nr:aminoglycoside 6-adenylyltransferase [Lachnospiraceae bacterium]